jgi:hypothetical protein
VPSPFMFMVSTSAISGIRMASPSCNSARFNQEACKWLKTSLRKFLEAVILATMILCRISCFSYAYRFIADTPGTHWYHGHLGTDRGFGLLGAFIVKESKRESKSIAQSNRDYILLIQVKLSY